MNRFGRLFAFITLGVVSTLIGHSQTVQPTRLWIEGGKRKLFTEVYKGKALSKTPILVVAIHGDAPFNNPGYQYQLAANVVDHYEDVISVGLLRPGYTDPNGNVSEGVRGKTNGDNWNEENTDTIALAIKQLAKRWNARRVVVMGHSGGASITANMLGRHPDLIDAALLVSLPSDVDAWREHMFQKIGAPIFKGPIQTLSAIDQVEGINEKTKVRLIVGSNDDITPPQLSERYKAKALKLKKQVSLTTLEGEGHDIFLHPAILVDLEMLINH